MVAKPAWSLRCVGTFRSTSPQNSLCGEKLPMSSVRQAPRPCESRKNAGAEGSLREDVRALRDHVRVVGGAPKVLH
eukprot:13282199-Alexandrium_andersonii.AAC.1